MKWAFKTLFDKLDKVVCYQGGKQHFSVNAFTDIILGAVSGVGHGDSYYRNGRILKENNMNHTQTTFPGMDTPVYMKSYLSEEMIKAAKECEVKELHWMNSVSDEKMMSMIMDAFQLIITNERENAIERFVRWQRNTLLLRMMVKRNGLLLLWNAGAKRMGSVRNTPLLLP